MNTNEAIVKAIETYLDKTGSMSVTGYQAIKEIVVREHKPDIEVKQPVQTEKLKKVKEPKRPGRPRKTREHKSWTHTEDLYLKKQWPNKSNLRLAKELRRTKQAIAVRLTLLKKRGYIKK